jgi:hypothetical protein
LELVAHRTLTQIGIMGLIAALLGCRPGADAPPLPPDFTTLKRDLLELDQSLALSRRTGVQQPDRFIAALDQLERDYRLQRDKPTGLAQQLVEAVITNARVLRQAGAKYAAYAAIYAPGTPPPGQSKTAEAYWDLLKQAYLAFHPSPQEDRIDLAVQTLEAAEKLLPRRNQ